MRDYLGVLETLPERERTALIQCGRDIRFPSGSFLYHEGQHGDSLFIINRGRVGVWTGGERGNPALVNTLSRGDVFGEMALLGTEKMRTASVQALSEVEVVQFLSRDIEAVLERHPRTYVLFIDILVRRVHRLNTRLAEFVDLDGPTRVHRQLCILGEADSDITKSDGSHTPTVVPLAQHHVASLSGVSLRLASSVLSDASRRGWIRTSRGQIEVLDWSGIRSRAGLNVRSADPSSPVGGSAPVR